MRRLWNEIYKIVKNRKKKPFSWKIEQYAFGAVDLRNQIKQHKEADEEPWGIFKAVGIRIAYVYLVSVTLVMVLGAIICQKIDQFMQQFKR